MRSITEAFSQVYILTGSGKVWEHKTIRDTRQSVLSRNNQGAQIQDASNDPFTFLFILKRLKGKKMTSEGIMCLLIIIIWLDKTPFSF